MTERSHYEVLDGLRGVAAVAVLIFHVSEITQFGAAERNLLPHGQLAVDFFFGLSGFVVGHAYDRRWTAGMGFREFALRRLVRLHPMVVLATLIGLVMYLFGPFRGEGHDVSGGQLALITALALLILPYPSLPGRFGATHSLDGPTWTLFQEYIGNAAYALVLRHFPARILLGLSVLAAAGLVATGFHFGTLAKGYAWDTFWVGFVRLAFPFLFGLWLHRSLHRLTGRRLGLWPLSALLLGVFALPLVGASDQNPWNGALEAGLVILVFPAIILLGAHSDVSERTVQACRLLGRISYPLYILHYPFINAFIDYRMSGAATVEGIAAFSALLPLAMLALAWAGLKYWDEPLRAWLSRRLRRSPKPVPDQAGRAMRPRSVPSWSQPRG